MLVGRKGIAAAYYGWGQMMQANGGTRRLTLDDDEYNRQLHYMTDNGAYYCFCNRFNSNKDPNDPSKHYDVPMHITMKALQRYHKELGLKVGLYHLDPFWHSHHLDGHCDGVTASNWSHSSFHWPDGLGEKGKRSRSMRAMHCMRVGNSTSSRAA